MREWIVEEVQALADHKLSIRFGDGLSGEVDLSNLLFEGVFAPLADPIFFSRVFIEPETQTLAWPNGVDIAPEPLRREIESALARLKEVGP